MTLKQTLTQRNKKKMYSVLLEGFSILLQPLFDDTGGMRNNEKVFF